MPRQAIFAPIFQDLMVHSSVIGRKSRFISLQIPFYTPLFRLLFPIFVQTIVTF